MGVCIYLYRQLRKPLSKHMSDRYPGGHHLQLFLFLSALAVAGAVRAESIGCSTGIPSGCESKITHGYPDGNAHSLVGAVVAPGNTGHMYARCSAVLVSRNVMASAAHCSWSGGIERVTVTFEPVITDAIPRRANATLYPASGLDLAAIVVDVGAFPHRQMPQTWRITYPELPRLNQYAALTSGPTLTLVGYGVTEYREDPNVYAKVRQAGTAHYRSGRGEEIRVSGASNACWQDSGGPVLDGNTVVGVIVSVDEHCSDHTTLQQLGTPAARAFLGQFVVLP